jgi:hypothetical protein
VACPVIDPVTDTFAGAFVGCARDATDGKIAAMARNSARMKFMQLPY